MDINDLPQNLEETSSRNPIYRFITAWSKWNLPLKISSMLVVLTVVATGIYYTLATTGQIAFLGVFPSPTAIPVSPPVTPPYTPSPSPSYFPSPPPTSDPNARPISCEMSLYKIPPEETGNTASGSGYGYFRSEYLIDPFYNTAQVGDRYAYDLKFYNPNSYWVGSDFNLTSKHVNSGSEPIEIVAMGGACTNVTGPLYTTHIKCSSPHQIPSLFHSNPRVSIVVKVVNPNVPVSVIGTGFTGVFGTQPVSCGPVRMKFSLTPASPSPFISPSPSPLPTPSISPTPTPSSYFTCIYQCVVKSRQSIAACREICKK